MHKKLVSLVVLIPLLASIASADLIGYWPMDEGEGTVVADASGNGNDGTIMGDTTWVSGQLGRALSFDGDGDYVDLGAKEVFNPTGSFSVSLWVNIGSWSGNWGNVMIGNRGEGGIGWQVRKNGGYQSTGNSNGISFTTRGVGFDDFGTTDVPPTGEWLHFAAVYDNAASTKTVYVNGVLDRTGTVNAGTIAATETNTFIGCRASGSNAPESFFTGVLDDIRLFSNALNADEVVALTLLPAASAPSPTDKATDVRPDSILSWRPGADVVTHNVYFGTSREDVEAATVDSPLLVAQLEAATTSYDPAGMLELGTTYYWRVDEVDSTGTTWAGIVWSFDSEALAYDVTPVGVTATTTSAEGKGPENLINESGLTDGAHDVNELNMWTGNKDSNDVALEFEFDGIYKFAGMQVWNLNLGVDNILGFGVKDVMVEYSVDANEWTELGSYEIPRATYQPDYTGTAFDLEGIVAQYIKINVLSNRNMTGTPIYGLSEVAFSYVPVLAREPEPADDATDVAVTSELSWRPGREAASHKVSFGTDANAVADGLALVGIVNVPTYNAAMLGLQLGEEYFWMITEANDAETPASWDSDVWSFSTPDYVVVDDMESYNDEDNYIYSTWTDSIDDTANGGSQVAPEDPPYTEQTTVHGGKQAMIFQYGLNGASFSEIDRTIDGADWTVGGGSALVLYFYGNLDNVPGQLYVIVNGTRVNYTGPSENFTRGRWNQAVFSLTGVGASNVKSLTIGIDGAGAKGTLLVDDLRIYRVAPADPVAEPIDPGTEGLMAYYKMENNYTDSSGSGITGTAVGAPAFEAGLAAFGTAVSVAGADCVDLGVQDVFNPAGSFSVSLWAKATAWDSDWGCVMMGNRGEDNIGWQIRRHASTPNICFTTRGVGSDDTQSNGAMPLNEWAQITCVYDNDANIKRIYINGALDIEVTTTADATLAATTHNTYIGARAVSDNSGPESYFTGLLDEIKFFDRALSAGEAEFLSDPTP